MASEISLSNGGVAELTPSMILLVDDDPDIRVLTRTFLEHEGYSVLSSGDAERAIQIFRSVPQIDLVVTDLYMPGRSGMELGLELKALRSELPVLLISGWTLDGEQEAGLKAEGWSFLAKPFRLTELLATVHQDTGSGGGAEVAGGETGSGSGEAFARAGLIRGVWASPGCKATAVPFGVAKRKAKRTLSQGWARKR